MQNEVPFLCDAVINAGDHYNCTYPDGRTITLGKNTTINVNKDYYVNPRLSQSKLKDLKQSPKHFWDKHIDPSREPQKDTEAMAFGRAVHMYVFEDKKFLETYIVAPKFDKRTKEGKAQHIEFIENNQDKELISIEEWKDAENIRCSIYRKNIGKILLTTPALIEHELYWNDIICILDENENIIEFNIDCKAKLDYFVEPCEKFPNGLIVDLKTTINATSEEFGKSIYKFGYHNQVAFYCKAVKQIYKTENYPTFIFIAAEKNSPYECAFYSANEDVMIAGLKDNARLMGLYAECMQKGEWHGYEDQIVPIGMPAWAMREFQDNNFEDLPF